MNVCMVTYSFYESDTRVLQYAEALAERGDHVRVIALRRDRLPRVEVMRGVEVHRIQERHRDERTKLSYVIRLLRFFVAAFISVSRQHFQRSFDIVHVHNVPDFLVFVALVPKIMGAGVILDIHDILPEFAASKFALDKRSYVFKSLLRVERICASFADFVIVANELWHRRLLSRSLAPSTSTVIRNYPNRTVFCCHESRRPDGNFIILYPGSLNRHQGVDIAILAVAKAMHTIPGCAFRIYGEGPMRQELEQMTADLGLSGRVSFHGHIPAKEIAVVMAAADLAVVPKRADDEFGNEAASGKIMEFMSLGVPVIASRTRIESLYFDDSQLEFFESGNPDDLADRIVYLWRDEERRRQLREHALQYVAANSWDNTKCNYFALVDQLSAKRKSNAVAAEARDRSMRIKRRAAGR